MYSNLVPFETIVERVKDSTGITNLRNHYPKLRRMIFQVEKDLGYGGTAILKRITYKVLNDSIKTEADLGNTIIVDDTLGTTQYRAKLPVDILYLEEVGMCNEGLCPGDYTVQGNYIFICKPIEEFSLIYWTLILDNEGNPVTTENHTEAVVAGLTYMLYRPKIWNGKEGSLNVYREFERFYHDRLAEARGDDMWPSTELEWNKIADLWKMSYRDILIYSDDRGKCFCSIPEHTNPSIPSTVVDVDVYYWQYDELFSDISNAPSIDQAFLNNQSQVPIANLELGQIIPYINVGRVAFGITNVAEDVYRIMDSLGADITDVVFDKYYNPTLELQIYISKVHYIEGEIYYKFI